jgi:hypothetical protein
VISNRHPFPRGAARLFHRIDDMKLSAQTCTIMPSDEVADGDVALDPVTLAK